MTNLKALKSSQLILLRGTAVAILYVKDGFALATDSLAIVPRLTSIQAIQVQKIFKVADRIACVMCGDSHFYDTATGEECKFSDFIDEAVRNLSPTAPAKAIRQISENFHRRLQEEKRRMKVSLKAQQFWTELIFVGFQNEEPFQAISCFANERDTLLKPTIEQRVLRSPRKYLHGVTDPRSAAPNATSDLNVEVLRKIAEQSYENPDFLPGWVFLRDAVGLARSYVEITIALGVRAVGGKVQLAQIPRDGRFSFVTPPV